MEIWTYLQLKSKCFMISHLSFKIKTSDQLKMISFCLFLSLVFFFLFRPIRRLHSEPLLLTPAGFLWLHRCTIRRLAAPLWCAGLSEEGVSGRLERRCWNEPPDLKTNKQKETANQSRVLSERKCRFSPTHSVFLIFAFLLLFVHCFPCFNCLCSCSWSHSHFGEQFPALSSHLWLHKVPAVFSG